MPIKETQIDTALINPELGGFKVPVYYTDELIDTPLSDLAFSSVSGILRYLFVGYFTDGAGFKKWFFSNARRHEEMRQAVEQDLGKKLDYTYGQIWLNQSSIENGEWRFDRLIVHSQLPNKNEAEQLLRKVIKPEYLDKRFKIDVAGF